MKPFLFAIILVMLSARAYAQHHETWVLLDSDRSVNFDMTSFDMATTRSGLVGLTDKRNQYFALTRYTNSAPLTDIYVASSFIYSVIIVDQSLAYFTVKGDGIYSAGGGWKTFTNIYSDPNAILLAIGDGVMLANLSPVQLNVSGDGGNNFTPAIGLLPTDTVTAAAILSPQIAIALTGKRLYKSIDAGNHWFKILDTLQRMNSIYFDAAHGLLYIDGTRLMVSHDSGTNWQNVTSFFFGSLTGPVIGAKDCSGTLYIGPDPYLRRSEIYRSVDEGKFFQDAGTANYSSTNMKKGVVLDRGSTFFFLDSSGLLSVVRDGIDSVITDSVASRILIQPDSGITNSLCPGTPALSFGVSLSFDQCTGIILDSLRQITPSATFVAKFTPGFLADSQVRIPFTFHASHPGWDTAHYRLRFHSPTTQNIEKRFFDVVGFGVAGSPDLVLSATELDFPITGVDSSHQLSVTISNPGCGILTIDTLLSTNPAIFIIKPESYPIAIAPGKSITFTVAFSPHTEGEYLESLEIGTTIGNRYITLRGTASSHQQNVVSLSNSERIHIAPNPTSTIITITSDSPLPDIIRIFDLLGRQVSEITTAGKLSVTCDLRSFSDGCYLIDLGKGQFERIIVRH